MNSGNFVDAKSLYTLLENSHQQMGCTTELMLPCPYISRQGIFLEQSHAKFVWHAASVAAWLASAGAPLVGHILAGEDFVTCING